MTFPDIHEVLLAEDRARTRHTEIPMYAPSRRDDLSKCDQNQILMPAQSFHLQ